jgi:hypothetical protein
VESPKSRYASVLSSLEKWDELVIGAKQVMIGDNNHCDNGNGNYSYGGNELLHASWGPSKQFFTVDEIQKLVGKLARLGERAPWIYKVMSHLHTSLAVSLKKNKKLLEGSSFKFQELIQNIKTKQFY